MPFQEILSELEKAIPQSDKKNEAISNRGVDWHLDHSLKIINSICESLLKSEPKDYTPKFSLAKWYILLRNGIPRGKGRSPKPFNNKEAIDRDQLPALLITAKESLSKIHSLNPKSHFRHPMFGDLKLEQAIKFINIHTNHHLKIIDEILNAA